MIKKIHIVFLIAWLPARLALAQTDYRYTQFLQNPLPVNPAFTGIEDFVDLKIGYRAQWAGFEGAPTSMFLSTNLAFKLSSGNDYKDRGIRLFEANAYNEKETDDEFGFRKGKRQGFGMYLMQNQDGQFTNLNGYLSYAYHLRITNQLIWSVGAGVGYEFNKFDPSGLTVNNPANDPTYQAYLNSDSRKSNLNINVGTVIYHRQFWLGYSAINAGTFNLGGSNAFYSEQTNVLTHSVQIGFRYRWRYGYWITPSLLMRMQANRPMEMIGAVRVRLQEYFWAGLQYSYLRGVSLSVGTLISKLVSFNYAYEFPTSQINRATLGSHEIILAIRLHNHNYSRAYLW